MESIEIYPELPKVEKFANKNRFEIVFLNPNKVFLIIQ